MESQTIQSSSVFPFSFVPFLPLAFFLCILSSSLLYSHFSFSHVFLLSFHFLLLKPRTFHSHPSSLFILACSADNTFYHREISVHCGNLRILDLQKLTQITDNSLSF